MFGRVASLCLTGLLLFALPVAATERLANLDGRKSELPMAYRIFAGGLPVMETRLKLQRTVGGDYEITFQARSIGLLGFFNEFSVAAEVRGDPSLTPEFFRTTSLWNDKSRLVEMHFRDGRHEKVLAKPSAEEDERRPVPQSQWAGTVDPLTATFRLIEGVEGRACSGEEQIFDGRRRYDVSAQALPDGELEGSNINVYAGPVARCKVRFEQIGGFWEAKERRGRAPQEAEVELAALEGAPSLVPVRIRVKTRLGMVIMQLVAFGEEEVAALDEAD